MTLEKGFNEIKDIWFKKIQLYDNKIILSDGYHNKIRVEITDEGQQCCEYRFIHTDDNLDFDIPLGNLAKLEFIELPINQEEIEDNLEKIFDDKEKKLWDDDYKEMGILKLTFVVHTRIKNFTFNTYNIHNGYYGGFSPTVSIFRREEPEII